MMSTRSWTVLATLLLACAMSMAAAELVAVYTVNRHGARNVLPKSANLSETDAFGGPTLLPAGKQMCFEAGTAFRARYLAQPSCSDPVVGGGCLSGASNSSAYGLYGDQGVEYHNYNTLVRSSGLDRTLLTSQAFLAGAFPDDTSPAGLARSGLQSGSQLVPIYAMDDSQDWLVRGYTRCPAYEDRLNQWFSSPEFQQKSADSAALRSSVGSQAPNQIQDTSLPNWWNVYDPINVWRTYNVGTPMPVFSNDTFAQIRSLAYWLELSKASSELSGNLLGGAVLGDMLQRLGSAAEAVNRGSPNYMKLMITASHYNTQLALLAAIQLDQYAPAVAVLPWLTPNGTLPALASVVSWELHSGFDPQSTTGGSVTAVRLMVQDGPAKDYMKVPLPCSSAGDAAERLVGAGACTWEAFVGMYAPQAFDGFQQWCDACQNTEIYACMAHNAQLQGYTPGAGAPDTSNGIAWKVAVSVVCTLLGTLAIVAAVLLLMRRRRREADAALPVRGELIKSHTQPPLQELPAPSVI